MKLQEVAAEVLGDGGPATPCRKCRLKIWSSLQIERRFRNWEFKLDFLGLDIYLIAVLQLHVWYAVNWDFLNPRIEVLRQLG